MQLPNYTRILIESIPTEHREWFSKILLPLNRALTALVEGLNRGLTFQDNFNASIKTITFVNNVATYPLELSNDLTTKPMGVLRMQFADVSEAPLDFGPVDFKWTYSPKGTIEIYDFKNLVADHKYTATFLIF